jgi:hypothetical protein
MRVCRRRLLLLLPTYLAFGAAAAVLVAWFRPFGSPKEQGVVRVEQHGGQYWATTYRTDRYWSSVYVMVPKVPKGPDELNDRLADMISHSAEYRDDMALPGWAPQPWLTLGDLPPTSLQGYSESRDAWGWPMRCVMRGKRSNKNDPSPRMNGEYGSIRWKVQLPIRPMPLGMVVDASLFALAVLPIHQSLAWTWRWWRVHFRTVNRLCPRCGYDRRGLVADSMCPECGSAA